jgi:Fic family protein
LQHIIDWFDSPFADGNGRVARITLDAMLRACGVNGSALWSISRGLAKQADTYKSRLALADEPRHGDLDGRGNLSEQGLAAFCRFGLQVGIDQARFMAEMFDLDGFAERVDNYFRHVRKTMLKPESAYLYMHAWTMGEFERGEAERLTGLGERTARTVLEPC